MKVRVCLIAAFCSIIGIVIIACHLAFMHNRHGFVNLKFKTNINIEEINYGYSQFNDGNYYISEERNVYTRQKDKLIPLEMSGNCKSITSTKYMTIILDNDNVAKIYLSGLDNQLYFKKEVQDISDIKASPYYFALINNNHEVMLSMDITDENTLYEQDTYEEAEKSEINLQKINGISNVSSVAASEHSILILDNEGEAYTYGSQSYPDEKPKHLDMPDNVKITNVFGNEQGYYIQDTSNKYYFVGVNNYSQKKNVKNTPVLLDELSECSNYFAFYYHTLAIKNGTAYLSGYLFNDGENLFDNELVEKDLADDCKVFITKDGWGYIDNSYICIKSLADK